MNIPESYKTLNHFVVCRLVRHSNASDAFESYRNEEHMMVRSILLLTGSTDPISIDMATTANRLLAIKILKKGGKLYDYT